MFETGSSVYLRSTAPYGLAVGRHLKIWSTVLDPRPVIYWELANRLIELDRKPGAAVNLPEGQAFR